MASFVFRSVLPRRRNCDASSAISPPACFSVPSKVWTLAQGASNSSVMPTPLDSSGCGNSGAFAESVAGRLIFRFVSPSMFDVST